MNHDVVYKYKLYLALFLTAEPIVTHPGLIGFQGDSEQPIRHELCGLQERQRCGGGLKGCAFVSDNYYSCAG